MKRPRVRGFTLVELLVVVVVIGVLLALLISWTLRSTQAVARHDICMNHLKQLTTATHNFDAVRRRFPGYGEYLLTAKTVPDDAPGPDVRTINVSWAVMLLPYSERLDLWEKWNDPDLASKGGWGQLHVYLQVLVCPSNPPAQTGNGAAPLSYVANCGIADGTATTPGGVADGRATGVFLDRQGTASPTDKSRDMTLDFISAKDGTAYTLMYSENLQAGPYVPTLDGVHRKLTVGEAEVGMIWDGVTDGSPTPTPPTLALGAFADRPSDPARPPIDYARPSSNHPGVVIVSFCDGHCSALSTQIDYQVFRHLMTPDGQGSGLSGKLDPNAL